MKYANILCKRIDGALIYTHDNALPDAGRVLKILFSEFKTRYPEEYSICFSNLTEIYVTGIEHHNDNGKSIDILCQPLLNTILLYGLFLQHPLFYL
jgi:hypothetical protein